MKIDFIITWVDGDDPEWLNEKKQYTPSSKDDSSNQRYKDWNLLRYWFRAVENYAPWVNKIHFVTYGHLPKWLNLKHPQLNIVNHRDFIPPEYLPTFNSHTIELNLHRIHGLEEHFVYFNDDTFLNTKVSPKNFFKNGLPVDRLGFDILCPSINQISDITYNTNKIISKYINKKDYIKNFFGKVFRPSYGTPFFKTLLTLPYSWFSGFYNPHLPISFKKEYFIDLWKKEYTILNATCKNKFRSSNDVSPWLIRYYYLIKGDFCPTTYKQGLLFEISNDNSKLKKHF